MLVVDEHELRLQPCCNAARQHRFFQLELAATDFTDLKCDEAAGPQHTMNLPECVAHRPLPFPEAFGHR